MTVRFDDLVQQIVNGLWEEQPVEATFLGVHAYDGVMPRADGSSREAYRRQRSAFLQSLFEYRQRLDELDGDRRLDFEILSSQLEFGLRKEEEFRPAERRADTYPSQVLWGIYLPAMRNFAPLEERLLSIRDRLRDTPRYLAEGIENLRSGENIPRVWTETGLGTARGGEALLAAVIPALAREVPALESELLAAAEKASSALTQYIEFVERELLSREDGGFAIGRETFDYLLRREQMLPYDADDLREFAERTIESTQSQLAETAAGIEAGVAWPELVSRLKDEHPSADSIIDEYRNQMQRARDFVVERGLVTIPEGESLTVMETPEFERPTIPYAAYVPAAAFEPKQEGIFWVTPVGDEADAGRRKELPRDHNKWGIPVTALHEGYPGHHLQFCRANSIESVPRRMFWTNAFVEGWALYCEEMMEQEGFLDDPRHRLLRLKDQLWRACRVAVDVGLHCFGMGFDEAIEMMVNTAHLERPNARVEVTRYTMTPTQPMSYLIGKREILALRRDVEAAEGERFDLRRFHDRLLSFGSIPVSLVRGEMLPGAP